jgi:hypothetical protein
MKSILKKHIENEMDFYLGVIIANIHERYTYYALSQNIFTSQQISSTAPLVAISIFIMIPILKEEIKENSDYKFHFIQSMGLF